MIEAQKKRKWKSFHCIGRQNKICLRSSHSIQVTRVYYFSSCFNVVSSVAPISKSKYPLFTGESEGAEGSPVRGHYNLPLNHIEHRQSKHRKHAKFNRIRVEKVVMLPTVSEWSIHSCLGVKIISIHHDIFGREGSLMFMCPRILSEEPCDDGQLVQ